MRLRCSERSGAFGGSELRLFSEAPKRWSGAIEPPSSSLLADLVLGGKGEAASLAGGSSARGRSGRAKGASVPPSLTGGGEASILSDSVFRSSWSGTDSLVPCIAWLMALLNAWRTPLSSEKRTSCFVGWTLTSTWRGSTSTLRATGG